MPALQNTTLGFGVSMAKFDEVVADLCGKGFQDTEGNILNIVTR